MQRRRFLKLAFGILAASTVALLSVQIALADSLVVVPGNGQASAQAVATYTFGITAANCPVGGKLSITFWWDSSKTPIGTVPLSIDANRNCTAMLAFVPAKVPGADVTPTKHSVLASPPGAAAPLTFTYVIDPPPQPPSPMPTPTPSPTPTPTPPPPPPLPATNAPSNPPPVNSPPVSPSPSPEACKAVAASIAQPGPGGLGGGLALLLVLAGALPISGMVIRRRHSAKIAVLLALAGLVVG